MILWWATTNNSMHGKLIQPIMGGFHIAPPVSGPDIVRAESLSHWDVLLGHVNGLEPPFILVAALVLSLAVTMEEQKMLTVEKPDLSNT